jgi:hypothetical protein
MSTIVTYHHVKCPYCQLGHHVQVEMSDLAKTAIFYCDACDRQYAVQVVLLPRVQIFELTPASSNEPIESNPSWDIPAPAVQ